MSHNWKRLVVGVAVLASLSIFGSAQALVRIQNQRAEVCIKFSHQLRETIREGDHQTQRLKHIPGFGQKERSEAHRQAQRTLRRFSDASCERASTLLP